MAYFRLTKKSRTWLIVPVLILVIALVAVISAPLILASTREEVEKETRLTGVGTYNSVHWHARIALFVIDNRIDLSLRQYQLKHSLVHVEDGDGETLHIHATGITIKHFLQTILPTPHDKFILMVNGRQYWQVDEYQPRDGDTILISNAPTTKVLYPQWRQAFS